MRVGRSSRAGFAPIWRRSRTSNRPCDRRAALIAHLWARSHPRRPIDPADRGLLRSPTTDEGRCRRAAVGAQTDQVVVAVGAVWLLDPATSRFRGDHLARFGRLVRTEVLTLDVGVNYSIEAQGSLCSDEPCTAYWRWVTRGDNRGHSIVRAGTCSLRTPPKSLDKSGKSWRSGRDSNPRPPA